MCVCLKWSGLFRSNITQSAFISLDCFNGCTNTSITEKYRVVLICRVNEWEWNLSSPWITQVYGEKVSVNLSGKTMSSLPCEVHVGHWLNQTPKVVHVSGGKYPSWSICLFCLHSVVLLVLKFGPMIDRSNVYFMCEIVNIIKFFWNEFISD